MFRTLVQEHQTVRPEPGRTGTGEVRKDVAVLGGGLAGMATALRLQARGLSTVVFEAHGHVGGLRRLLPQARLLVRRRRDHAGRLRARPGSGECRGVGAELLDAAGIATWDAQALPGYVAWLPDRTVTLHRDPDAWRAERLRAFGDTTAAPRVLGAARPAGRRVLGGHPGRDPDADPHARPTRWPTCARCDRGTCRWPGTSAGPSATTLRRYGLRDDGALVALLGMLVEDTVHSTVDRAPLVNAALGITIRGAGLSRHRGGMHGFWRPLVARYRELGGDLRTGCRVSRVDGRAGRVPGRDAPRRRCRRRAGRERAAGRGHGRRRRGHRGRPAAAPLPGPRPGRPRRRGAWSSSACPRARWTVRRCTHHQLLHDYDRPLGDGNNMFVSVSARRRPRVSAPAGHRAVMISTHTELSDMGHDLATSEYARRKRAAGERAHRAAPAGSTRDWATAAVVCDVGTPRTYQRFTSRPRGAVGGVRQSLRNANQHAVPHDLGVDGLWLVGDTTWPGLGTVACALGSRIVADRVRPGTGRSR